MLRLLSAYAKQTSYMFFAAHKTLFLILNIIWPYTFINSVHYTALSASHY